jgi:hypothetical protein
MKTNKCVDMEYYYIPIFTTESCKPLKDVNIVVSTYTGYERLHLMTMGESLGANMQEQYMKKQKPLLICSSAEGAKYQAALKWSKFVCSFQNVQILNLASFRTTCCHIGVAVAMQQPKKTCRSRAICCWRVVHQFSRSKPHQ